MNSSLFSQYYVVFSFFFKGFYKGIVSRETVFRFLQWVHLKKVHWIPIVQLRKKVYNKIEDGILPFFIAFLAMFL